MSRKRKLSNLTERCRLCLAEDGSMIDIFHESIQNKIEDLSKSTSVIIKKDDNLPKNVCHVCLYKLNMWQEFKQNFIGSNQTLMMHLELAENSDFMSLKAKIRKEEDGDEVEKIDQTTSNDQTTLTETQPDYSSSKDSPNPIQENGNSLDDSQKSSPTTRSPQTKRTKVTERRKASTKRWVARKKALIAATGEDASDSESGNSDSQLSPVQKARAKTNAEKEAERQRRLAKALRHLATDMVGEKIVPVEESRRTRSRTIEEENFPPRSVRAELEMGDATYIVTSTLFFAEAQNSPVKDKSVSKTGQGSGDEMEENTDIIDAVQLRRINPPNKENSFFERCLNIEVEGSELEALERVQQELAIFVEKDMKQKMMTPESPQNTRGKRGKDLDTQLKNIVEKAIRKNYEASQNSDSGTSRSSPKVVSPAFMEAAMRSKIFQPKVVVQKMEIDETNKGTTNQPVNNLENEPPAMMVRERRAITTPLRYQDYEISDSVLGLSDSKEEIRKPVNRKPGPALKNEVKNKTLVKVKTEAKTEKHFCTFCNQWFDSRIDIEAHIQTHKVGVSNQPVSAVGERIRRMRCKRCHEIVEARLVKMHKCQELGTFKCLVCNAVFKTPKLLQDHELTHPKIKVEKENKPIISSTQQIIPIIKAEPLNPEPKLGETTCFLCDKKFTDEDMLKDHLQRHCDEMSEEEEKPKDGKFLCAICNQTLESEEAREAHEEKHLYDDEDDNPNLISIENAKLEKSFSCSECGESFASELLLVMHTPLHEEEAEIAEWEKRREDAVLYSCEMCDATFTSEMELGEHTYTHEGQHICMLCGLPFENEEELQKHVAIH